VWLQSPRAATPVTPVVGTKEIPVVGRKPLSAVLALGCERAWSRSATGSSPRRRLAPGQPGAGRRDFYLAVKIACGGLMAYARRCADAVRAVARSEKDPARCAEPERIVAICERVPARPARTFRVALQAQWFLQIGIVDENALRGMDPGR
jgi:pyruvate-formate lyase